MMRLLVSCLLLASSLPLHAEAYRWIDPAGRTVISDTPPPANARSVSKAKDPTQNVEGRTYAVQRAVANFPVLLYTAADCVAECRQARDLLNARGVPFTERLLQKPEDFDELRQLVGDAFIPSLKVGRQSMRGFDPAAYNNLLDLAGYPATAPLGSKPSGGLAK